MNLDGGFYTGMHIPGLCRYLDKAFVSVNVLKYRKKYIQCPDWIMDSGAFTEISRYGRYRDTPESYYREAKRWFYPGLRAWVTQDYMCEPFILRITGMSVEDHQRLTIERYDELRSFRPSVYLMPVLQGYNPAEYVKHLKQYGERLSEGAWIGVGSVCKRNNSPYDVYRILRCIKDDRPDLRLHGFGLKITALADRRVISLLHTADSMAWSYAARVEGRNANGIDEAQAYTARIKSLIRAANANPFIEDQPYPAY